MTKIKITFISNIIFNQNLLQKFLAHKKSLHYFHLYHLNLSLQLSNSEDYDGGDLLIDDYVSSREFGTGIFFPADVFHEVTPITRGARVTLIGHSWGPYHK